MQKMRFGVHGAATGYTGGASYSHMELMSAVCSIEAQKTHGAKVQSCRGTYVHESVTPITSFPTHESLYSRAQRCYKYVDARDAKNKQKVAFHRPVLVRAHQ